MVVPFGDVCEMFFSHSLLLPVWDKEREKTIVINLVNRLCADNESLFEVRESKGRTVPRDKALLGNFYRIRDLVFRTEGKNLHSISFVANFRKSLFFK